MIAALPFKPLFGIAAFFMAAALPTKAAQDTPPAETAGTTLTFVTITINNLPQRGIYAVLETPTGFLLENRSFDTLGLLEPAGTPTPFQRYSMLPLSSVPGLTYQYDSGQLHISITCTADCFPGQTLGSDWRYRPPDPTPLGFFMNYDLVAEVSSGSDYASGLLELAVFSGKGVGTTTFAGQDLTGSAKLLRLESSWTMDFPDKRRQLQLGDSITNAGGWGSPVRFAGARYGTDFMLQPGFITFPTPVIAGSAALPSTAEVFVNGIKRSSLAVDPGPFSIEHLPVITGAGDLKVVVKDLLGRETVLVQPFYATRNLLKKGLSAYSVSAGVLRENFGRQSNQYEEPFFTGTYRKGLGEKFTAGLQVEASTKRAGFGPYVDWQLPFGGLLSTAAAVSLKGGDVGTLFETDLSWSSETFGFYLSNQYASSKFTRLGAVDDLRPARLRSSANLGIDLQRRGSLAFNYTRVDERDRDDFELVGATYSVQLGKIGGLGINVSRRFGTFAETTAYFSFTTRLGQRTSGNAMVEKNGKDWAGTLRVNRNAPWEGGFGFRAEARQDDTQSARAGATYNTPKGIVSLDVSHWKGTEAARLGMKGGIVMLGGSRHLSRPVDTSFALVKVDDFEGIGVLQDNRQITETNKKGEALVTGLRPYEENRIGINPLDLPLSAEVGDTLLKVVPRRRSGLILDFPASRMRAALVRVLDENGTPLPPGTTLHAADGGEDAPVGFRGQSYITGLSRARSFFAHIEGETCRIEVDALAATEGPVRQPDLICRKDTP